MSSDEWYVGKCPKCKGKVYSWYVSDCSYNDASGTSCKKCGRSFSAKQAKKLQKSS